MLCENTNQHAIQKTAHISTKGLLYSLQINFKLLCTSFVLNKIKQKCLLQLFVVVVVAAHFMDNTTDVFGTSYPVDLRQNDKLNHMHC